MPVRVKPFGSVLVRERSRRIEAAAARSVRVCTRYPRPTHKETAERSAGQGGEGAGWGDEGHSEAAAEERRKKGEREREREKRHRVVVCRASTVTRGDGGLSSRRVYAAQWTEGAGSEVFLIFSLVRARSWRGATSTRRAARRGAGRGGRIEPGGTRERRQKSAERDGDTDRVRWTRTGREIGTDGDAANGG